MAGDVAGIKLHADKYESMIARRGRLVKWQEAVLCSCVNLNSGQPLYTCQACFGKGYVYEDPVIDIALVMSVTHTKEFGDMAGIFEVGDAIMTVPYRVPTKNAKTGEWDGTMATARLNPVFHVSMNDLITLTDDVYRTSEVLVRAVPLYGRAADTLLNEDVTEVIKVRKFNSNTGERTDYEKGTNFNLDGFRVVWIDGADQPLEGEQYTVVYEHRPVFTVFTNLPTQRYQDGQNLPRKVALRYRAGGFDNR